MPFDPNRRVLKFVKQSFLPRKIMEPLYPTTHLLLSKVTLQPALVNTGMPKSEAILRLGIMCPIRVTGRPLMMMLHSCVDVAA
jgi:hypothetical protein